MGHIGLNIYYSGIKYTEKDCVRLKVRHNPLLKVEEEIQNVGHLQNVDTERTMQKICTKTKNNQTEKNAVACLIQLYISITIFQWI